jgi:type IV secretory pathway VirB4 component|tara:strand:- start:3199 stop:3336 length:138 start_codon:yes stop_codon:yes gene_type:complete
MNEKNINLTESEIVDLKRALNVLIEKEQDQRDYTDLIEKLNSFYD